jgi:cyclic lactone autoinducer peptide
MENSIYMYKIRRNIKKFTKMYGITTKFMILCRKIRKGDFFMLKLLMKSRKFIMSIVGAFALVAGATSATPATMMWIQQPKCPKHLLK